VERPFTKQSKLSPLAPRTYLVATLGDVNWRERERLLYWSVPLAILPALAFLPAFVLLVFHPAIAHAQAWAVVVFPLLIVAEFFGVFHLVRGCVERPFNLLTMLSFGALMVLLVIVTYTGVFLVALTERM
jgi:hypothetical protein